MTRSMVHHYADDVFVLVHNKQSPKDAEWDAYIDDLKRQASRADCIKTLVFTEGGNPDGYQRKRLNDVLAGRPTLAAVMTHSFLARAVVGTLAVFNPRIRAFSPDDAGLALAYLKIPMSQYGAVLQTLARLKREMGLSDSILPEPPSPGTKSTNATL